MVVVVCIVYLLLLFHHDWDGEQPPPSSSWPPLSAATVDVVIGIIARRSEPSAQLRQAIRDGWLLLRPAAANIQYRFIIGRSACVDDASDALCNTSIDHALEQEHHQYQDILFVPCPDDYEHLTEKVHR
jgi:hypothetical protein